MAWHVSPLGGEGGRECVESSRPTQESGCTPDCLKVTLHPPQPTSAHLITGTHKPQRKSMGWGQKGTREMGSKATIRIRYDCIFIRLDTHTGKLVKKQGELPG